MIYPPPLGSTDPNASYVEGNPQAGVRGSYPTAAGYEAVLREMVAICAAGKTAPVGAPGEAIAAIKSLIGQIGAAPNGGLGKGASGFALNSDNLPVETAFNAGDKIPLFAEESEDGLTAGTPFAGTLGGIGGFIAGLFQQAATFTQITPTNLVGLSLAQTGDYTIPRGVTTTVPLSAVSVSAAFGSVSGGVLTVAKAGYYIFCFSGALFISSSGHADDFATLRFDIVPGGQLSDTPSIASGGGQASANFLGTTIQHLNAGDQVYLQAFANTEYGDGANPGVAGYTNLLVALLNS